MTSEQKVPAAVRAAKITRVGVIVAAVIAGIFSLSVLFRHMPTDSQSAIGSSGVVQAATIGSNSPITSQVATTAGSNSPIIQAAQGSTVNYGVSEATVLEILKQKEIETEEKLAAKYPQGYVLLGIANGKTVHEPKLKEIKFDADWEKTTLEIDPLHQMARISIYNLQLKTPGMILTTTADHESMMQQTFPFVENTPTPIFGMMGDLDGRFFIEVLDSSQNIFILGFK